MKIHQTILMSLTVAALSAPAAFALRPKQYSDSMKVPERAIIVSGDKDKSGNLVGALYDSSDLHYSDPTAPRFLFLDRKGKIALGIGGYVKGTLQYDFGGAIDNGASFVTYDIPVPNDPSQRNQFYGNANHSTIFLQLVGKSDRFGYYQMYLQTYFAGNGKSGYGLKLKQAYLKVGYVTAGLASSTFIDGSAGTPVIDDHGPAGELNRRNILVRYAPRFSDHLSAAIGIEAPVTSYTIDTPEDAEATVKKINQRCPDIPAYVQYEWGGGKSHVRFSALFRDLSYRNLLTQENHFKAGWAVQLSGKINPVSPLSIMFQGAYGHGYGSYVYDLQDHGFDMIESETPGRMTTPRMANFEVGLRYNVMPNLFLTTSYSQARVYGQSHLGPDTFRYSQYLSLSGFYDIVPDLRIGLEYLRGDRANVDGTHGHANRISGMLQYSF